LVYGRELPIEKKIADESFNLLEKSSMKNGNDK